MPTGQSHCKIAPNGWNGAHLISRQHFSDNSMVYNWTPIQWNREDHVSYKSEGHSKHCYLFSIHKEFFQLFSYTILKKHALSSKSSVCSRHVTSVMGILSLWLKLPSPTFCTIIPWIVCKQFMSCICLHKTFSKQFKYQTFFQRSKAVHIIHEQTKG